MVEEIVAVGAAASARTRPGMMVSRSTPRRLGEISGDVEERLPLTIGEFSRVLGGGVVPGSVVLIGGDPGIGKSTSCCKSPCRWPTHSRFCMSLAKSQSGK